MLNTLQHILMIAGGTSVSKISIEVSIGHDNISLVVLNHFLNLPATTADTAKFTLGLLDFIDFVKTYKYDCMHFIVEEEIVILDYYLTIKADTTFLNQ